MQWACKGEGASQTHSSLAVGRLALEGGSQRRNRLHQGQSQEARRNTASADNMRRREQLRSSIVTIPITAEIVKPFSKALHTFGEMSKPSGKMDTNSGELLPYSPGSPLATPAAHTVKFVHSSFEPCLTMNGAPCLLTPQNQTFCLLPIYRKYP